MFFILSSRTWFDLRISFRTLIQHLLMSSPAPKDDPIKEKEYMDMIKKCGMSVQELRGERVE